jgi:hypothetical protein
MRGDQDVKSIFEDNKNVQEIFIRVRYSFYIFVLWPI